MTLDGLATTTLTEAQERARDLLSEFGSKRAALAEAKWRARGGCPRAAATLAALRAWIIGVRP